MAKSIMQKILKDADTFDFYYKDRVKEGSSTDNRVAWNKFIRFVERAASSYRKKNFCKFLCFKELYSHKETFQKQ
ncbi:MAG TPA: hypothetical protein ENN64_00140 [bacterium]|nr:hypothetical protein [bacterium]